MYLLNISFTYLQYFHRALLLLTCHRHSSSQALRCLIVSLIVIHYCDSVVLCWIIALIFTGKKIFQLWWVKRISFSGMLDVSYGSVERIIIPLSHPDNIIRHTDNILYVSGIPHMDNILSGLWIIMYVCDKGIIIIRSTDTFNGHVDISH